MGTHCGDVWLIEEMLWLIEAMLWLIEEMWLYLEEDVVAHKGYELAH